MEGVMLTHGALFNGIGGFQLAAEWAGIQNVWSCEIDPFCNAVTRKHFPEVTQYNDIRDLKNPPSVDIISGGFPCQDISIANQKKGTEKGIGGVRSGLWKEYERIITEVNPSYIVFENSPFLLKRGFEVVLSDLSRIGYNCEWRCFYGTQFGFPHLRKRVYGLAYPFGIGCDNIIKTGGILRKVLPERTSRQDDISMPAQRVNRLSDFSGVRMDDGFSDRLHKSPRIHALGNAVIPQIPEAIFKAILQTEKEYAA